MEEPITGGHNDDKADSVFSEVTVNLSAGVPYYIRVNEANGGKTYARLLVTSAGQTAFTVLKSRTPIDLSKASGKKPICSLHLHQQANIVSLLPIIRRLHS